MQSLAGVFRELGNGCFSLEADRLGKLQEVSIADTQKAVQDALQVSKSFLHSSCYTRVLFCVNHPALYRCVVYPRASQMVRAPLLKQLNPTLSGFFKVIHKTSVITATCG